MNKKNRQLLDELKGKQPTAEVTQELNTGDVIPNTWNPNIVDKASMVKLKNGIKLLLDQKLRPPPIIVRQLEDGSYQIVDGYHRWVIFKELKQPTIPAYVLNVDEKTAKILTNTLNYLRGRPDEKKYGELISDLINNQGADLEELAGLLPEDRDELVDLLSESNAGLEALMLLEEEETKKNKEKVKEKTDDNIWLDLTFRVSKAQAEVIEKELSRVEATLKGKNRRGRALEFVAVQSSLSPLPEE